MVHQHFMLQEEMTILENIVLCSEPVGRFGFVDFAAARRRLKQSAEGHGIAIRLDRMVGDLSVGERQVVEIMKGLYREAEVLILDEPTSVLTPQEKDRLFAILKSFRAAGKAIVLITHKLDEVWRSPTASASCAAGGWSRQVRLRRPQGGDSARHHRRRTAGRPAAPAAPASAT